MLNINELEARWLRYKIKSYMPHTTIGLSLFIIILVIIFVDFDKGQEVKTLSIKNIAINESIKTKPTKITSTKKIDSIKEDIQISTPVIQSITQNKELNTKLIEDEKLIISPSLDFIRNIKENSPTYYKNDVIKPKSIPQVKKIKKVQSVQTPKIEEVILDTHVEEIQSKEIKIKRQNVQSDIQHVIKRFKKSNNPALSLFIAKKYYELGNYNQSYNYSLITNEINNDIEDSWIIFAKSLYMLNKKEKAIQIINKYISSSHSQKASLLLKNIKSGKIK